MDNYLNIEISLTPHPTPRLRGVYLDPWGRFILTIANDRGASILLDWQWGLDELAEGFVANQAAFRSEELSMATGEQTLPGESLAQAQNRFRDREDFADQRECEVFYDRIWTYYRKHAVKSWMVGVAMPDIVIGLNRGQGEISLATPEISWAHTFGMDAFLDCFQQQLQQVLALWIAETWRLKSAPGYRVGWARMQRCLDLLEIH